MNEHIYAPWTPEQVQALNKMQRSQNMHPYTCGKRNGHPMDPEGDWGVLVATENGWICRHCDYTQNWAHAFSADEEIIDILDEFWRKWRAGYE